MTVFWFNHAPISRDQNIIVSEINIYLININLNLIMGGFYDEA